MPRPPNEPTFSYGKTWMPEYSDFEPFIDYFDPKRLEIFYLRQKVEQAELYGKYKSMKYEDALQEWKDYLNNHELTLKKDKELNFPFYREQISKGKKIGGRKSRIFKNKRRRRSRKYKK
jgi:hypothetical protein